MDCAADEAHLGSGCSEVEEPKKRSPLNSHHSCSGISDEQSTTQKKSGLSVEDSNYSILERELVLPEENDQSMRNIEDHGGIREKSSPKLHSDNGVHNVGNTNLSTVIGEDVAPSIPSRDEFHQGSSNVLGSGDKQSEINTEDDKKRKESSAPEITTRSLSPNSEIKDANKRPALICNFFSKGWCIKGSSCRFLHIKDHGSSNSQQSGVDTTANGKGETQLHEEKILTTDLRESERLNQLQESMKGKGVHFGVPSDPQQVSPSKDSASLPNRCSSSIFKNNLLPEWRCSSSGSVLSSSNYHNGNPSSYTSNLEELSGIRNNFIDRSSPVSSRFLNSSLSSPLPPTGIFPSHPNSEWIQSSSFSSLSMNASHLGAQKQLDNDKDYNASKSFSRLRSFSPFVGLKPENISLGNSADYKTKITSNDWEPSEPFRPSLFIRSTSLPSPESLYDPLRDSIDQPVVGDRSFCAFSSQGVLKVSQQGAYCDLTLSGSQVPECSDDKNSSCFQNNCHENLLETDCRTPHDGILSTGAEVVGTSAVDEKNKMKPKDKKSSVASRGKDIPKTNKMDVDHDSRHQSDRYRQKGLKADRIKQENDIDFGAKSDGSVHKEPKAMRHFRAALVDNVKELLKPTWREGHLGKDDHNVIVKKAVDKVLSTLQSHQIPATMESVHQYLSSSQPKIVKLVQGYVDKYRKS